jgi:hypothetical protein
MNFPGLYDLNSSFDSEKYSKWRDENAHSAEMPRNANELGAFLESLLGKDFVGYKGGNFKIEEYKPLWLEPEESSYNEVAIIGIDKDLKLITKDIEQEAGE